MRGWLDRGGCLLCGVITTSSLLSASLCSSSAGCLSGQERRETKKFRSFLAALRFNKFPIPLLANKQCEFQSLDQPWPIMAARKRLTSDSSWLSGGGVSVKGRTFCASFRMILTEVLAILSKRQGRPSTTLSPLLTCHYPKYHEYFFKSPK